MWEQAALIIDRGCGQAIRLRVQILAALLRCIRCAVHLRLLGHSSMISKCANRACSEPFLYLRGKIFQMERWEGETNGEARERPSHNVEHFWLCSRCSAVMTLVFEKGKRVVTAPLTQSRRGAA